MVEPVPSFRDFEDQGLSSEGVGLGYTTTQANGALLDRRGYARAASSYDVMK
jgi:hypothetical protein